MRIVKLTLIVLFLVCMGIVTGSFFFLDQSAVFLLQKMGAEDVSVKGLSCHVNQIHVDGLTTVWETADGGSVRAELSDASFQYDIKQILRSGKGRILSVQNLDVTLTRKSKSKRSSELRIPKELLFLKKSVRARLPLEKLEIAHLQLYGDTVKLLLGKSIQIDAVVNKTALAATLSTHLSAQEILVAELHSADSSHIRGTFRLQKDEGEQSELILSLSPGRLSGEANLDIETVQNVLAGQESGRNSSVIGGRLSTVFDILSASDTQTVSATVKVVELDTQEMHGSLIEIQLNGSIEEKNLVLDPDSRVQVQQLYFGTTEIQRCDLDIGGNYRLAEDRVAISFIDHQTLNVQGLTTEKMQFQDFTVQPRNPLFVTLNSEDKRWSVVDNTLNISGFHGLLGASSVDATPLYCSFSGLKTSFSKTGLLLNVQTPSLQLSNGVQTLPLKDFRGSVKQTRDLIEGKILFSPENIAGRLALHFEYKLDSSSGKFSLETEKPFALNREGSSLASLIVPWRYPFNLDGGIVSFGVHGSWGSSDSLQLSASIDLIRAGGYFQQFLFEGLDIHQKFSLSPDFTPKSSGSIVLRHLIGGIDVYDIVADINLGGSQNGKLPVLQMNSLRASLFDGRVTTSNVEYDINKPDSSFVVKIDNMDLTALVDLIKMEKLKVTGKISGTIPVVIKDKQVVVVDALLESREPGGEIHYLPGELNQSGIAGYALKAVENLQYQKLLVKAGYLPSGQLDLDISLQGHSPELQTSRPVQLNIHAEQNLPALMQSLRFSKGLTEKLDKRVKQNYN